MKRLSKRTWVAVAIVLAIAFSAIGAFAYWTTSGSGTGSGTATTNQAIVVVQTSASSGLYPGGNVALSGNFNNPASFNQYVTSVSASITPFNSQTDNTKPACTEADFSLAGSPTAVNAQVGPGNGVGTWSGITLSMTNAVTNQDNCKNVTVPLAYTSN